MQEHLETSDSMALPQRMDVISPRGEKLTSILSFEKGRYPDFTLTLSVNLETSD